MYKTNLSKVFTSILLATAALAMSQSTFAAVAYNQNVTPDVIFGSGNANGSFTTDRANSVEVGMRGKLRYDSTGLPQNTFNSNGDGTYSFAAGVAPTQSSPTAVWSFEWSINSNFDGGGGNLNTLTYELGIDSNPGTAQTWSTFDPINVNYADHAIGTNATGNGGGTVATDASAYANLINTNNVAQNSWKAHWYMPASFDPTVDGQYDFYLAAFNGTTQLARTDISIIVGAGAVVPVPAALWLFGSGLLGLVGIARRKKA